MSTVTPEGERPKVVSCNIESVDGRLTIAPGVQLLFGEERWSAITGDCDPYRWMVEVHDPQVFLEGSGSFVPTDAPSVAYPPGGRDAALLEEHFLPGEVVDVPGRRWMAVVDGRGRVQLQFREWPDPAWAGWHALMIVSRAVDPAHLAWLRGQGIPYLVAGDGPVDLPLALRLLRGELGVTTVVATGGGRMSGALLRADLVDEIDLEVVPAAIGGRGTPALFDGDPLGPDEWPTRLRLLSNEATRDGHLRLRYAVDRG
jgi:riboflavin biosynthesis pyrimidine reductase